MTKSSPADLLRTAPRGKGAAPRTRGFILMEALLGGVLVATAILATFVAVGEVRAESTRQSRGMVARDLALQQLEIVRGQSFGSTSTCSWDIGSGPVVVDKRFQAENVTAPANYTITITKQCVTERVTTSRSLHIRYKVVTVTVSFDTAEGPQTTSASTRVYENR